MTLDQHASFRSGRTFTDQLVKKLLWFVLLLLTIIRLAFARSNPLDDEVVK